MAGRVRREASSGVIGWLLRLYPASFRAEYAAEMGAMVARRRREVTGPLAVAAFWLETVTDSVRAASGAHLDVLRQDLRYGARILRRTPGFTLAAIVVIALALGANTAVFSLTDHVLLRPLPFTHPEQLVKLWETQGGLGYGRVEPSPANYRDWKQASRAFQSMGAYADRPVNLLGTGDPRRLEAVAVTADLLPLLGVHPALGRLFRQEDDRDGAPGTVLLSDGLWRTQFAGDVGIVGRRLLLNDGSYEVIGVMPREFRFPSRDTQLWMPIRFEANAFDDRTDTYLKVVARLRPEVRVEQAQAELHMIARQLEHAYPAENDGIGVRVLLLRDEVSQQSRSLLLALVAAGSCVLLIACTNLANLLLARATGRRTELAVRTALGAGRERLVRQLLTESCLLAGAGGLVGLLVAASVLPLLARLVPTALPITAVPPLDLRLLAVATVLTACTGLGFGIVPGLRLSRDTAASGLREGQRGGTSRGSVHVRSLLVVAEVASSVVLVIAAGLLLRALWHLEEVDPGFRAAGVITLRTALPLPKYALAARQNGFYDEVLTDVRCLPGVTGAAYATSAPMVVRGGLFPVEVEGRPEARRARRLASLRFVTPGYFAVLGIPLRAGRDVAESDTIRAPLAAVVSESFVRRYWPDTNPLGRRFTFGLAQRIVVGVVGDIRERGVERDSEPQVYLPARQRDDSAISPFYTPKDLLVRSATDSVRLVPAIRDIVHRVDPEQPVSDVRSLADIAEAETAPRLTQVRVLGAFACVAFLLVVTGIHAVLSSVVSSRTREIGIRVALGATYRSVVAMVAGQGLALGLTGIALGAVAGYAGGRMLQTLLIGVAPDDPLTFLGAVGLSLVMTLVGSLMPTVRALRLNPTTAIRS